MGRPVHSWLLPRVFCREQTVLYQAGLSGLVSSLPSTAADQATASLFLWPRRRIAHAPGRRRSLHRAPSSMLQPTGRQGMTASQQSAPRGLTFIGFGEAAKAMVAGLREEHPRLPIHLYDLRFESAEEHTSELQTLMR